jgi:alpha-L-fucosidase
MKINNEAIYNTVRWKTPAQWGKGRQDYKPKNGGGDLLLKLTVDPDPGYAVKECFFTYNPVHKDLYAILPKWPAVAAATATGSPARAGGATFTIHGLTLAQGTQIELLETQQPLTWHQQGKDLVIVLPPFDPEKMKSQYAFVIKIKNIGNLSNQ